MLHGGAIVLGRYQPIRRLGVFDLTNASECNSNRNLLANYLDLKECAGQARGAQARCHS